MKGIDLKVFKRYTESAMEADMQMNQEQQLSLRDIIKDATLNNKQRDFYELKLYDENKDNRSFNEEDDETITVEI